MIADHRRLQLQVGSKSCLASAELCCLSLLSLEAELQDQFTFANVYQFGADSRYVDQESEYAYSTLNANFSQVFRVRSEKSAPSKECINMREMQLHAFSAPSLQLRLRGT